MREIKTEIYLERVNKQKSFKVASLDFSRKIHLTLKKCSSSSKKNCIRLQGRFLIRSISLTNLYSRAAKQSKTK